MSDQSHIALPPGYRLENYRLDSVLGHGGFGITYQAVDEDLQQVVAIKEYLPREVAFRDNESTVSPLSESDRETFEWGLERFLDEGRTLARFRHPNIVGVRRFLRANGTAYLVMDYCAGESLESVLAREGTLSAEHLEAMLEPLLNALEALHAAGVTHRDIKPGNIYLREDGSPVLLDFGAARQALAQHSRSVTAMATPGYAAFEQYSTKGRQGPWTDIYGLGATLYRCVTGDRPPDASDRMLEDDLAPAVEAALEGYPLVLLAWIDAALRVRPKDRPQSVADWRRLGLERQPSELKEEDAAAPRLSSKVQQDEDAPPSAADAKSKRSGWVWVTVLVLICGVLFWAISDVPNQPSVPAARAPPAESPRATSWPPESGTSSQRDLIEGRYRILGTRAEIVEDTISGLQWQRCSRGQTWDGETCIGQASLFTWDETRRAADQVVGLRLPSIDELKTLVYCSSGQPVRFTYGRACSGEYQQPTIALQAFPNTPSVFFWSSSINANNSSYAWDVDFFSGSAHSSYRGEGGHVRLVRGERMSLDASSGAPEFGNTQPAGDPAAGKELYAPCVSCHQPRGQGAAIFPKIADRSADYIAGKLKVYRAGGTVGVNTAFMAPHARGLTDKEIADLAAYIASF